MKELVAPTEAQIQLLQVRSALYTTSTVKRTHIPHITCLFQQRGVHTWRKLREALLQTDVCCLYDAQKRDLVSPCVLGSAPAAVMATTLATA